MEKYIVMVRTDSDDRSFTETALAETGSPVPVKFIQDIHEMDGLVTESGKPSLILLNDKGAAHSSTGNLISLKSNPAYSGIPVILLGEVSTEEYIRSCYKAGANSFIVKPSTVADTSRKISLFLDYWFNVAEI